MPSEDEAKYGKRVLVKSTYADNLPKPQYWYPAPGRVLSVDIDTEKAVYNKPVPERTDIDNIGDILSEVDGILKNVMYTSQLHTDDRTFEEENAAIKIIGVALTALFPSFIMEGYDTGDDVAFLSLLIDPATSAEPLSRWYLQTPTEGSKIISNVENNIPVYDAWMAETTNGGIHIVLVTGAEYNDEYFLDEDDSEEDELLELEGDLDENGDSVGDVAIDKLQELVANLSAGNMDEMPPELRALYSRVKERTKRA